MVVNLKFEKRKKLCGLGVSAVKKGYRRGAEPPSLKLRRPRDAEGFLLADGRWKIGDGRRDAGLR